MINRFADGREMDPFTQREASRYDGGYDNEDGPLSKYFAILILAINGNKNKDSRSS